ncbi:pilin [Cupriavidus pampae]|uniref:pilin n=1 Tax=Cupriavidus pampae TaxID=659251 RepID=UPI001CC473D1
MSVDRLWLSDARGALNVFKRPVAFLAYPESNANGDCNLGCTASSLIDGANKVPAVVLAGNATIIATLGGSAANAVQGATITWTRDAGTGTWTCGVTKGANGGWNDSYAPSSCPVGAAAGT